MFASDAQFRAFVERQGHDLTVTFASTVTNGWDDDGNQIPAASTSTLVRGILTPVSDRRRMAAAGQQLPVPSYAAYIPFPEVDLSSPDWHLEYQGVRYYPTRDAQNVGGQGICWLLELGSPGEVVQRG